MVNGLYFYPTADHHWVFDTKIKESSYYHFKDERGNLPLKMSDYEANAGTYHGPSASLLGEGKQARSDTLPPDDCLSNLRLCKYGLSVAFALKGK